MTKKTDDKQRKLKRCAACPWARPREYGPYPRLWDYMTSAGQERKLRKWDFACWYGEGGEKT